MADVATVTSAILTEEEGCAAEASQSAGAPDVFVGGAPIDSEKRDASPCTFGKGDKAGFADIGARSAFGKAEAAKWAFVAAAMPAEFASFTLPEGVPAEAAEELPLSVRGALAIEGKERPKRMAEISMEPVLSLELLESSFFFSVSAVLPPSPFLVERLPSSTGLSRCVSSSCIGAVVASSVSLSGEPAS